MVASPSLPETALSSSSPDIKEVAHRGLEAAEAVLKAATADAKTPKEVKQLAKRSVEESRSVLAAIESTPSHASIKKRNTFAEFTTMLGEEVKEVAEQNINEATEKVERQLRKAKSLIEDHFQIDEAFRMLGPLTQDSNLSRDVHDWFNLIALIPVNYLNIMNWRCKPGALCGVFTPPYITTLWDGSLFLPFWWTTLVYFVIDLLWMILLPNCVRSPGVIIKHHVATLGYICIPYMIPERVGWLMGICMIVEVNTWFLIARRAFNKNGDKPFAPGVTVTKSLRLCLVSTCFYITWFVIRLIVYPVLLPIITKEWLNYSEVIGRHINCLAITPLMQCVFIALNVKWTVDLFRSKLKSNKGKGPAKGL